MDDPKLERTNNEANQTDEVVPVDLPWYPDAGATEPVLYLPEGGPAVLILRSSVATPEEWIVLSFAGPSATVFGYPNDEALAGHPLYERGLGYYGIFEVKRSSWIARLAAQNRVQFPDFDWPAGTLRHFVVTGKGSTFECLASNLTGWVTDDGPDAVIRSLLGSSDGGET